MIEYDYLIVGAGLFGASFARLMSDRGKRVMLVDRRPHIGGNCYTQCTGGIHVHKYGAHIFHTSDLRAWSFVNRFTTFNHYVNRPKARWKDKIYSFPINLMTLHQLWGVTTPQQARARLEIERIPCDNPANLEEWILSQVGREIYETFIYGYTTKQWGRTPDQLPAEIIQRLPIRLTFDDNYFFDPYQGIPVNGYTKMFESMLRGIPVELNADYLKDRSWWDKKARKTLFTGMLDELFDYTLGRLEYRRLYFEEKQCDGDFQGNAVVNHVEREVPYTRSIEHKHFNFGTQNDSIVSFEYSSAASPDAFPAYPVNTPENMHLYNEYRKMAENVSDLLIGGRLGFYRYMDMDSTVLAAMQLADKISTGAALNA